MMRGDPRSLVAGCLAVCCWTIAGCWNAELAKDGSMMRPPDPPIWTGHPDGALETEPPPTVPVVNDVSTRVQPGPVTIFVRRAAPRQAFISDRAVLRVDLPAGHSIAPGVAEVLAQAVSKLPAAGGPSLREAIRNMGGELEVRVGIETASFTATVPVKEWPSALRAMIDHLKRLSLTRDQLARLKQSALRRELAARTVAPLLSLVSHLLRNGIADPNPLLDQLEDCALPQLVLLHARYYQPRNMVIGLWVPGAQDPEATTETAMEVLSRWEPDVLPAEPKPEPRPPAIPSGIHWVDGPGPSRLAVVLPVASSIELMVLQQVLSLDGVGGRLGKYLRRSLGFEPAFKTHHVGHLGHRFLVLETSLPPELVIAAWRALEQARVSMVQDKPQGLELKIGVDRVRLLLLARDAEPDAWCEAALLRVLDHQEGGPAQDFATLAKLHAGRIASELPAFARQSPIMVVLGGAAPANPGAGITITRGTNALAETRVQDTRRSMAEKEAEARRHLDRAVRAIGGEEQLRLLQGFCAKARRRMKGMASVENGRTPRGGASPSVEMAETTWYRVPDRLRRIVNVLHTEIETVVKGDQGIERSGEDETRLTPGESMGLWLEGARHPLILLAEYTRGRTRYQLVGIRQIAGRPIAILERIDADKLQLRLLIDSGSGLPRVVESWERRSGMGLVQVSERYDDYRTVGGLRIPHRRHAVVNDGAPVETLWETFVPKAPDDDELQATGSGETGR